MRLTLRVFNSAGEEVGVIAENLATYRAMAGFRVLTPAFAPDSGGLGLLEVLGPGLVVSWNGAGQAGQLVSSGSYRVVATSVDSYGAIRMFSSEISVIRQDLASEIEIFNSAGEVIRRMAGPAALGSGFALSQDSVIPGIQGVDLKFSGSAGTLSWDGMNSHGRPAESGAYVIKATQRLSNGTVVVQSKAVTVISMAQAGPEPLLGPNPWSGGPLRLAWVGASAGARSELGLYNLAGELVAQAHGLGPSLQLEAQASLSTGVYFAALRLAEPGQGPRLRRMKLVVLK